MTYGRFKEKIAIRKIQSIRYTTNPFVAHSLSVRRIEIQYEQAKTIQIAPKQQEIFVQTLIKQNPHIQVH